MSGKRSIGTLIKVNFADATRKELEEAHALKHGETSLAAFSDEELRAVVVESWTPGADGRVATAAPLPAEEDVQPIDRPTLKGIPNLSTSGAWGGRMRRCTIIKRDNCEHDYAQPLGWNGVIWNAPVGVPVNMPYPYWESMKNTLLWDTGSDKVVEWVKERGGKLNKITKPVAHETIRYTDHGDVAGTENLPTSYWDYFRTEALKNECFKKKSRSTLIGIHNRLYEPAPMWNFRDMTDHDIRLKIAMCLGADIEEIMQNEAYAMEA